VRAPMALLGFTCGGSVMAVAVGIVLMIPARILAALIRGIFHEHVHLVWPVLIPSGLLGVLVGTMFAHMHWTDRGLPGRPRRETQLDCAASEVSIHDERGKRGHSFDDLRALRLDELGTGIRLGLVMDDDLALAEWSANNADTRNESRGMARAGHGPSTSDPSPRQSRVGAAPRPRAYSASSSSWITKRSASAST